MRNKIYAIICAAMAMSLASCGDDTWKPQVEREGTLNLSTLALEVNENENTSRAMSTDEFIIEVRKDNEVYKQWVYNQMPDIIALAEGDYTVTARNTDVKPAAFSAPYYFGSAPIKITADQVSEATSIMCTFSNIRVSVHFSDALRDKMGDDCKVQVVAGAAGEGNSGATLDFLPTETRSGYFKAENNSTTLVATFEGTIDGNHVISQNTYTNVEAGYHYSLTYKVGTEGEMADETGIVTVDELTGINISFGLVESETNTNLDINGEDEINGEVVRPGTETSDDPMEKGDITITAPELRLTEENIAVKGLNGEVDIHADNGIAHLYVTISSDNTTFEYTVQDLLPLSFDLAYPQDPKYPELETQLSESLKLPCGDQVIGKTDVIFDITEFIPMLVVFEGTHTFTLKAVAKDKGEETVNIVLKVVNTQSE